jgi:hypothetical protein
MEKLTLKLPFSKVPSTSAIVPSEKIPGVFVCQNAQKNFQRKVQRDLPMSCVLNYYRLGQIQPNVGREIFQVIDPFFRLGTAISAHESIKN